MQSIYNENNRTKFYWSQSHPKGEPSRQIHDPDPVARGALLLARRLCCQAMWRIPTACRGNHESPNKDRPTLDSLGSIPASSSWERAIRAHGGGVVATGDRPTDMTRARLASRHGRPSTRAAHMIWARSRTRARHKCAALPRLCAASVSVSVPSGRLCRGRVTYCRSAIYMPPPAIKPYLPAAFYSWA